MAVLDYLAKLKRGLGLAVILYQWTKKNEKSFLDGIKNIFHSF